MWNSGEQLVAELMARLNVYMQAYEYIWTRCYLSGYCCFYPSMLYCWELKSRNFLHRSTVHPTLGKTGPLLSKHKCEFKCNSNGM